MNKQMSIVVATLMASTALAGFGKDLYTNDFASRSSNKPMPGNQWYETSYTTALPAPLAYHYTQTTTNLTPLSAYGDLSKIQDGWTLAVGPETRRYVDFFVRTMTDSENPCACASNMKAYYNQFGNGMIVQPLYNVFASGRLRVSADFKAPHTLNGSSDENIRISLLRQTANPPKTYSFGPSAVSYGIVEGCTTLRGAGAGGWGYSARIPASGNVDKTHWFRLVLDANLDAKTFAITAYDMGTNQPTLATPTPASPYGTANDGHLSLSGDSGPITAIGFYTVYATYRSTASDGTVTADLCPAVDNLRVWWRADAGSFDESNLCYENDFLTRRVRTLVMGSKTAEYASSLLTTNAETYVFGEGYATSVQNDTSNLAPGTSGKTKGRDDWLQIKDASNLCKVYATGGIGGNVLASIGKPSQSAYFARVNHPIGTTIDTTYVKAECDVRTPSAWTVWGSGSWIAYFSLESDDAFATSNQLMRVGYCTDTWANKTKFFPYRKGSESAFKDTGTELKASTWYRLRVIANRSTGKMSYEYYELGKEAGSFDRPLPNAPVYSVPDIAISKTVLPAYVAFTGYDSGTKFSEAHLFDNVRIWKGSDGENWNLVYQNDFNKRVRYGVQTVQEAKLLSEDINRIGLDGWIRRGTGAGDMYIRNAANPYVTIESEDGFAHAVHTLKPTKRGKVTVRADIRPPSRMTAKATYPGCIYVGGDEYAQGETGTQAGLRTFTDAAFGCFGFARSGAIEKMDLYNHATLFVKGGAGEVVDTANVDLASWYRFVATFDLTAKTWRVDVYKQGTSQPTADSTDGTLVKSFENLTFINDDPSGISAVGIAGGGTTGDKPLETDKRSVLFDNLKVVGEDLGMVILLK